MITKLKKLLLFILSTSTVLITADDAQAQCQAVGRELVNYVNPNLGRLVAFQLASNKSRSQSGHFSITHGYLTNFNPRIQTGLVRFFPRNIRSIFQPVPIFVMGSLDDNNSRGSSLNRAGRFPDKRRDEVLVNLTENGDVTLVLRSWGNTVLTMRNKSCFSDAYGYYINGIVNEVNGTRAVSLVMRKYQSR